MVRGMLFIAMAVASTFASQLALASAIAAEGAAIQKVVVMLTDMSAKAKKDKQAEEVQYAEFKTWCAGEEASLTSQISAGASEIESLSAEVGKLGSDTKVLAGEISTLQSDISRFGAALKAHAAQREKDHKAFLAEQQDYAESIDALDRAIATLTKQNYDREALLQVKNSEQLPLRARQAVSAFLGMMSDDEQDPSGFMAKASPQANAYEFQSSGIVDLLKRLKDDFIAKKAECEKEEMSSKHAHEMIAQDLAFSTEKANEDVASKSVLRRKKLQRSATAEKQLASASSLKAEDEKTLSNTKAECSEKAASFTEKQRLRAEEIMALDKAIEILSSEAVQANGAKYLDLAQAKTLASASTARSAMLLQLGNQDTATVDNEGIRRRLREFLALRSRQLQNHELELLGEKLAVDPFVKVRKMIEDMITRLMEEAHSDADHEGFCDEEVGKSKITRNKLSKEIDFLTAEVDGGKATITMLAQDVARITAEVAALETSMKDATQLRTTEKAQNAATVKDSQDAQKAVQAAVAILKEFYEKAMAATAFLQVDATQPVKMGSDEWVSLANPDFKGVVDRGHKAGMLTFGDNYVGQQDEAGGVLAMLEVIASDFATLQADTQSAEALATKSYEDFMAEAKKDKAAKSKQIALSSADKASTEAKLREDVSDLKFSEDKLLAAERYYETIASQCDTKGMTFEERNKARQAEIVSLKEALRILEGEDLADKVDELP